MAGRCGRVKSSVREVSRGKRGNGGVLCGSSLLLILALSWPCSEGFSPGHSGFPCPKNHHFQNGRSRTNSIGLLLFNDYLFIYFIFILFVIHINSFCPTCINQRC